MKTRLLLEHLQAPAAYVPVDISRKHLQQTSNGLARLYPDLEILPVCADFTADFDLPISRRKPTHCAVYFPGSTIGNFEPDEALQMLTHFANLCGTGGGLLIGIDLQKDRETLEAAYNDADGVTAEFNLNLLRRINRELDADFVLENYRHVAIYDQAECRVEISVKSLCEQVVTISDHVLDIGQDELIRTEYSHKYTVDGFAQMASKVGLKMRRHWTDEQQRFAVLHFAIVD